MNALRLFGFLFLTLFLTSCPNLPKKDFGLVECTDELIDLGTINLDRFSLEFFPYTDFEPNESIYFKNRKGKEIRFKSPRTSLSEKGNYKRAYYDIKCGDGEISNYTSRNERYDVYYRCPQLGITLYVELYTALRSFTLVGGRSIVYRDELKLKMRNQDDNTSTIYFLVTSSKRIKERSKEKGYHPNYDQLITLDTLDEIFVDVFKTTNKRTRVNELYYSMDLGLIAFNDTLSGFWIYDERE